MNGLKYMGNWSYFTLLTTATSSAGVFFVESIPFQCPTPGGDSDWVIVICPKSRWVKNGGLLTSNLLK